MWRGVRVGVRVVNGGGRGAGVAAVDDVQADAAGFLGVGCYAEGAGGVGAAADGGGFVFASGSVGESCGGLDAWEGGGGRRGVAEMMMLERGEVERQNGSMRRGEMEVEMGDGSASDVAVQLARAASGLGDAEGEDEDGDGDEYGRRGGF